MKEKKNYADTNRPLNNNNNNIHRMVFVAVKTFGEKKIGKSNKTMWNIFISRIQ